MWVQFDDRFVENEIIDLTNIDSLEFQNTNYKLYKYYPGANRMTARTKTYRANGKYRLDEIERYLVKPSTYASNDFTDENSTYCFQRSAESEHFVVFWAKGLKKQSNGNLTGGASNSVCNVNTLLRNAEKIWDIFNGSVMGEFVCDYIFPIDVDFNIHDELPGSPVETWITWDDAPEQYEDREDIEKATCLFMKDIDAYIGSGSGCYCWHISDLKVYDKPKHLCEFEKYTEHGLRPCELGMECQEEYYDTQENTLACKIDFSGDACPFAKMQRPPQSWCYVEES
jgi:hypothetical protein